MRRGEIIKLGRSPSFLKFLFGLLMADGCSDTIMTDLSSKKGRKLVCRKVSIRVVEGSSCSKINCDKIASIVVEFLFDKRRSVDFLLTFSYGFNEGGRLIRLSDDHYLFSIREERGFYFIKLVPRRGTLRTTPKEALNIILLKSGLSGPLVKK